MGNEGSKLKGLTIDKNSVEANDFWMLFNAESHILCNEDGRQKLSIFQGEVNGQLWKSQGTLERAIKNFMIYRHPYILKYVTTWERGGQKYLATERICPLITIMSNLSDIQICLGLRTILCSLIFLIEKANARHLNICPASIYVTENGSWRLAGFEYVWKNKEVTTTLLELVRAYRYSAAVDPDELKSGNNFEYIEQFAFATLCEEILVKCSKNDNATPTPFVQEFREYCATHLKHKNPQMRPKLSAVLLHPYFNHEFVLIHSFLFELPLKSVHEKQDFFRGLMDRLRYFDEEIVGAQLAADLLSRMVLLDPTAQLCVTPYVLKTKTDHSAALFSNSTYLRYLMPHIKKMFKLRDAQIRLILLEYFMEFVRLLNEEEIRECILPHLLAGMNDTNDVLVAKTLRCLADLVPLLGSAVVIGGTRSRIFSDGRPQAAIPDATTHWVEPRSITPVLGDGGGVDYMVTDSPTPPQSLTGNGDLSGSFHSYAANVLNMETVDQLEMPPRLSPDGGEDDKSAIIPDHGIINPPVTDDDDHIECAVNIKECVADTLKHHEILDNYQKDNSNLRDEEEDSPWSDWETDELQRLNNDDAVQKIELNAANNNKENEKTRTKTTTTTQIPTTKALSSSHQNLLGIVSSSSSHSTVTSLSDSYQTAKSNTQSSSMQSLKPNRINDDLNSFDIQIQKVITTPSEGERDNELDFFKDMEPVIETKNLNSLELIKNINNMNKDQTQTTKGAAAAVRTLSETHDLNNQQQQQQQQQQHQHNLVEDEIKIDPNRFVADLTNIGVGDIGDGWSDDDAAIWNATV